MKFSRIFSKKIAYTGLVSLLLVIPSCKKNLESNYIQNIPYKHDSKQFSLPVQTPSTEITSPTTKTFYYEHKGYIRLKDGSFFPTPLKGEIVRFWDEDRDDDGRYETTVINLGNNFKEDNYIKLNNFGEK